MATANKTLGLGELFHDLEVQEAYPTHRLLKLLDDLEKNQELSTFECLNFSGIEQVTDEVIHLIVSVVAKNEALDLKQVLFAGCSHLTDYGVYLIAKCFKNLLKVNLDGCIKVTERGLHHLVTECTKLEEVSMRGTDVGSIPKLTSDLKLSLEGCPVYNDLRNATETVINDQLPAKVVVMCDPKLNVDVVSYLRGSKIGEICMRESGGAKMKFNPEVASFEFHVSDSEEFEPSPFFTDGAVYVYAFDVDDNLEKPQIEIMSRWDSVHVQVLSAPFIILAFHTDSEDTKMEIDKLTKILSTAISSRREHIKALLEKEKVDSRERDFQFQQHYTRSLQANEFHLTDPVYFFCVEKNTNHVENRSLTPETEDNSAANDVSAMEEVMSKARQSIDNLSKRDISEVASFSSPPAAVKDVAQGVLVMFGVTKSLEEGTWQDFKKHIKKMSFLVDFRELLDKPEKCAETCKKLAPLMERTDINEEYLKMRSTAIAAMYNCLSALYKFSVEFWPKISALKAASEEKAALQKRKDHTAIQFSLSACENHIQKLYQWEPRQFSKEAEELFSSLPQVKIMTLEEYIRGSAAKPFGEALGPYRKALKRLADMGKILFYPNIPGEPIIFDIQWFMDIMNLHHKDEKLQNRNRVLPLTRYAQLYKKDDLEEAFRELCIGSQFAVVLTVLQHYGILLEVKADVPVNAEPDWYYIFFRDVPPKIYLWSNPKEGELSGLGEPVFNTDNPDDTEGLVSNYHHTKHFWPDQKLDTDVEVQYYYNFDHGFPLELFPKITAKLHEMFDVKFCCQSIIIISMGAVEVKIGSNLHGTRITGSVSVKARCTKFLMDEQPTQSIIHDYMWGVVNPICLCIESIIMSYPFLPSHATIPCQGSCAQTVYRHRYSRLELPKDANNTIHCPSCTKDPMSRLTYGLLLGRHAYLPFHDWVDETGITRCQNCSVTEAKNEKFWAMESSLYPTFRNQTFEFITAAVKKSDENEDQHENATQIFLSNLPLNPKGFKTMKILVLDSTALELHVIQDTEFIKRLKQEDSNDFDSNLERDAVATLKLSDGKLIKNVTCQGEEADQNLLKFSSGDVLDLDVKSVFSEDGWETDDIHLTVSKNGLSVLTLDISMDCFIAISSNEPFDTGTGPKLVIQTPTCPIVTSRHFKVNTSVVYKTGIGMQWAVGIIQSIKDGCLFVAQDESDPSSARKIVVNSDDMLPLCRTPGDMNITIGKELLKSSRQIYQFLNKTKTVPASMGLFMQGLRNWNDFHPLPLKGRLEKHPRLCTSGVYTPQVLSQTIENSIMSKNRLAPVSILFLPSDLRTYQLYHPSRHVVHDLANQALTQVCTGDIISRRKAVQHASHFLNEPTIALTDVGGLTSSTTALIWRAMVSPFLEGYHRLMAYPPVLKVWNKIFPAVKENMEETMMKLCLSRLLSLYFETMLLLLAVNTDIEMNPELRHDEVEMYMTKINAAFKSRQDLENGQCQSHQSVDWKLVEDPENMRAVKLSADVNVDVAMAMFEKFPNLLSVNLSGCCFKTLSGIGYCKSLIFLDISENDLEELPVDLENLKGTLKSLDAHTNPLKNLPDFITEFSKLEILNVSNTLIRCLPEEFGNLQRLQRLSLERNSVVSLPESFRKLRYLTYLNLSGVPWLPGTDMPHRNMSIEKYMSYVSNRKWSYSFAVIEKKVKEELYDSCDRTESGFTSKGTYEMQEKMFKMFPRLGVDNEDSADCSILGGVPAQILSCRNLTYLNLSYQGLKVIPDALGQLRNLQELLITDNPYLTSVSGEVAKTNIEGLNLMDCPALKTPPQEIIKQNNHKLTIAYLRRLAAGSVTCYRTKLMLVGLGEAGKTSLTRALMSGNSKAPETIAEGITDGIDIQNWQVNSRNQTLTYSVWDFAGQTVYYNTHQFFLSKRAIYILVWNMRLGFEHAGLDFWLNSIQCHAPDTPVFIVGTHADQVSRSELPSTELRRKFSNICGFFYISSKTGQGIPEFFEKLIETTFEQPYMGERIPEAWFNFEKCIISRRNSNSLLLWNDIETEASRSAVFGTELKQAVQFLHDLGSLQHFDNDFLRNRVVINPQWIVDVMACVVSVHNNVNKHGYLDHKDIATIWKDYDPELHDWLLRLTELFDLTFPLPDQDVNVVPCLLPQTGPEIQWPPMKDGAKRTEMLYQFESLPAGLFNRAQVRLYQFSDGSKMWKRGSVLKKNNHMAVITMEGENEVLVKAQGTRPENMILLVHEVFEGLITEFFRGVKYEYLMPCPECSKADVKHPTMFLSSVMRRAVELKAMHLQCHAFFHSLAISEVQALMPPQASEDYEVHMSNMVRDMEDLQNQLPFDVCILYCEADVPRGEADGIHPRQVKTDLEKKGFTVWYQDNLHSTPVDDVMKAMSTSKTIITFVSDSFVEDADCQRMFQFAQESMKKPILLAMTGKGRKWQQSVIGMKTAHQVYVNMQRVNHYQSKIQELISQVTGKVGKKKVVRGADVFLSYCWTNSAKAVEVGHAIEKPGSLGHGDPRQLKEFLVKEGFSVWIDYENVGVNGLFSDIAESLKKCKLVVACVSDEYAMSPNCQMEFRFAHVTLKKPIILAVVGTGYRWESTEVGLLSLGYPKMNFQVANNIAFSQLKEVVAEALAAMETQEGSKTAIQEGAQKQSAFQELYELAQRKFLRQLSAFVENSASFPRLFVLDLQETKRDTETVEAGTDPIDLDVVDTEGDKKHHGDGEYCFRLLCEHEGGWHAVHDGFPIQLIQDEVKPLLQLSAPFFARILSILKHSNINLHCLNSTRGDALIKLLEQHAGVNVDIGPFYVTIRDYIIKKDIKQTFGGLARCYLPSGKFLWLCPEHQKLPRVSKLDVIPSDSTRYEESDDYQLIDNLKSYQDLVTVKPQGIGTSSGQEKTAVLNENLPERGTTPELAKAEEAPLIMPAPPPVAAPRASKSMTNQEPSPGKSDKPAAESQPSRSSSYQKPPEKVQRSKSVACTVQ